MDFQTTRSIRCEVQGRLNEVVRHLLRASVVEHTLIIKRLGFSDQSYALGSYPRHPLLLSALAAAFAFWRTINQNKRASCPPNLNAGCVASIPSRARSG